IIIRSTLFPYTTLFRSKKNFAEGRVTNIQQASPYRIDPFCPHFGTCGGCKWQHMTYEAQLKFKQQYVDNVLSRIGKVDTSAMERSEEHTSELQSREKLV